MKYKGIVKDRMGSLDPKETRWHATYKDAHDAAERLCKVTIGERGTILVQDEDGEIL